MKKLLLAGGALIALSAPAAPKTFAHGDHIDEKEKWVCTSDVDSITVDFANYSATVTNSDGSSRVFSIKENDNLADGHVSLFGEEIGRSDLRDSRPSTVEHHTTWYAFSSATPYMPYASMLLVKDKKFVADYNCKKSS
jgi:hypothetical protein